MTGIVPSYGADELRALQLERLRDTLVATFVGRSREIGGSFWPSEDRAD